MTVKKIGQDKKESKGPRLIAEDLDAAGDEEFEPFERDKPVSFDRVLSTGSTLLDLAISGGRIRGGGLPGGMMIEIFGLESTGKSALLAEMMAATQHARIPGDSELCDPEGRFGERIQEIYGLKLPAKGYSRVNTVAEMFSHFDSFANRDPRAEGIGVFGCDSLAALSTGKEMEEEDKRGQLRAKEFSSNLRKYARKICAEDLLFICTNQMRDGDFGPTTPGGKAIRYYASLRLRLTKPISWEIIRKRKLPSGVAVEKTIGINTKVYIHKSSIDDGYREAPVCIEFGYGVDDIRANLQYMKDMAKSTMYGLDKETRSNSMDVAIQKVEDNKRVKDLRNAVIDLWEEIEEGFKIDRQRKERGDDE